MDFGSSVSLRTRPGQPVNAYPYHAVFAIAALIALTGALVAATITASRPGVEGRTALGIPSS